ncbi:MAG TPA: hypothetical protein PKE41_00100 [Candidatus Macondimonas sp.]|nr:hypothetical protein [Candidatus Macondimonas sp.]
MSRTTSPASGKSYGLKRVRRVLEFPRSTIHARQARTVAKVLPLHPARCRPKPKVADADRHASPFVGEGHREVWARLRILHGIRVSKDRYDRRWRFDNIVSAQANVSAANVKQNGGSQKQCLTSPL